MTDNKIEILMKYRIYRDDLIMNLGMLDAEWLWDFILIHNSGVVTLNISGWNVYFDNFDYIIFDYLGIANKQPPSFESLCDELENELNVYIEEQLQEEVNDERR